MSLDPVAFFFEHAARHLAPGPHEDASTASGDVFNQAYHCAIPMGEYAAKTLVQARQAPPAHRRRMLEGLARYRIADQVIAGRTGGATPAERATLRALRAASRAKGPAREHPAKRRPAPGSVVVARAGGPPYTIANVAWASACVEQRWLHEDCLGALIGRLADAPGAEPFVIAVAGRPRFHPQGLAFSARGRIAVCGPDRTETVDTARLRRLGALIGEARPPRRALAEFRRLARARALTANVCPSDERLVRLARRWGLDVNALHDLLLHATDLELEALAPRADD